MARPKTAAERSEPDASAVILPFSLRGKGGAGALAPSPQHGERPTLEPSPVREWLRTALILSLAVHVVVYLAFHLRFVDELERASGAAAASSEGAIAIPVEIVVEAPLPPAPAPADASVADAERPAPTPLQEEAIRQAEETPPVIDLSDVAALMPPPPEPEPVVLPAQQEAAPPAQPQQPAPSRAASPSRAAAANHAGTSGADGALDAGGQAAVSSYFAQIQAHLLRHRVYPPEARSNGISGVTRVIFSLGRDGRVLSLSLAGGSGHSVLDQAALAMVRRAAPFPPFPSEIAASRLEMGAPIRFDLR